MKAVPDIAVDRSPDVAHAFARPSVDDTFELELERARRASGWSFITMPAPIVGAPAVVGAAGSQPVVAWSSRTLTLVGIGIAKEIRGRGQERWRQLIAGAASLGTAKHVGDLVRPRFVGGLSFVPGGADLAPWSSFGDAWFVLPRWTYVHDGTRAALVLAVDSEAARDPRWRDELAHLRAALARPFAARPQPPLTAIDAGDRDAFRAQVREITDAIARGESAKIVAARSAVVTLAGEARVADMLAQLDARQAECVRLLIHPPGGGALVAATPERLVRLDGATVSCDALAGSVARSRDGVETDDVAAASLFASTKDRREHALVVDAIASALRQLGADVSMPETPGVRTLRQILHLHTPITAALREPRHVLELAAALHPTPAVGGTPTAMATDWISTSEAPRGWYASPVGWFDLDGNGELAVAIRSGVIAGERAHLWAGAGIVAGSDPDRELAETDLKLRAMLGALGVTEAGGER